MSIARSKITSQGQISVPARVRQKLGVGPGSILSWEESDGQIVVRRLGGYSSEEIHRAVFSRGEPKAKSLEELKSGLKRHIAKKHARD